MCVRLILSPFLSRAEALEDALERVARVAAEEAGGRLEREERADERGERGRGRTGGGGGGLARGTALGEQREEDRAVRRKDVVRGAVLLARTRRSLLRTPERRRKELQERGAALELCCLWCL